MSFEELSITFMKGFLHLKAETFCKKFGVDKKVFAKFVDNELFVEESFKVIDKKFKEELNDKKVEVEKLVKVEKSAKVEEPKVEEKKKVETKPKVEQPEVKKKEEPKVEEKKKVEDSKVDDKFDSSKEFILRCGQDEYSLAKMKNLTEKVDSRIFGEYYIFPLTKEKPILSALDKNKVNYTKVDRIPNESKEIPKEKVESKEIPKEEVKEPFVKVGEHWMEADNKSNIIFKLEGRKYIAIGVKEKNQRLKLTGSEVEYLNKNRLAYDKDQVDEEEDVLTDLANSVQRIKK